MIERLARWMRAPRRSEGSDRWLLLVAVILFAGAFVAALASLPERDGLDVRWPLLVVVALVAVPATAALNAAEYAVTARISGHAVAARDAAEVAVLSSAANLLPIPGAALVRARALRRLGSTLGRAVSVTAVAGVAWLAATLLAAGGLLLVSSSDEASVALHAGAIGAGLVGVAACGVAIGRIDRARRGTWLALLVGVEVATVAIGVLRYYLVIVGLDAEGGLAEAAALNVSVVAASALGFLPGGLGIREVLAAAIAPMVGMPAAVGLLVVAVDRLVGLPVLAAMALGFTASGRTQRADLCSPP